VLDASQSTSGQLLPPGVALTSQTLALEQTATEIRITGTSVLSNDPTPVPNESSLSLDGKPTVVGPISLSFKRINDRTFEIFSESSNTVEASLFVVSPDGQALTETKTRIEREAGVVKNTSTAVLLFARRR
jgi:hypothetical protein